MNITIKGNIQQYKHLYKPIKMNGIFANYLWTMFWEAYFEYFESCDFSRENTKIDVSVFMFDLRMINMSFECDYGWSWKISACSTEYEACDSFASLTRHQSFVVVIWNYTKETRDPKV